VKSNQYTYHVNIANDDVKKDVMSALIKNDYEVSDVSSERPSLEEVFVKLTAQPLPKKTLDELLEEMDAADGEDADSTPGTTEEEDK
jgi:hypothetical protein